MTDALYLHAAILRNYNSWNDHDLIRFNRQRQAIKTTANCKKKQQTINTK